MRLEILRRNWLAGLLCLFVVAGLLGGVSWGQEVSEGGKPAGDALSAEAGSEAPGVEKQADEEGKAKEEPRVGFLGDTSRFSRAGGWGSIGGAMGQWGLAKSMLVMLPPVQEELALTEEQKQALKDWGQQMRTRGEEWGRGLREREGGGDPFGGGQNVSIAARMQQFMGFMSQVNVILKENEAGVSRILDKDQRIRLGQIAYQMEGVGAVLRPEVARALNLSPSQRIRIQQVITRSRTAQMTTWMTQMMAMGSMRRNNRPTGGDQPQVERNPSAEGSAENNRPVDPERAERMRAMQKQFESTRDRNDQLQEQTATEVIKVLTIRQRKRFDKILGEPFDPAQVNALGREGGRNRRGAEEAEASGDGEKDREEVAPKASSAPVAPRP